MICILLICGCINADLSDFREEKEITYFSAPIQKVDFVAVNGPTAGTIRNRRAYSDVENSVGNFLDQVDFYLEKVAIFRNILLDVRQLYKVAKNDVLDVSNYDLVHGIEVCRKHHTILI